MEGAAFRKQRPDEKNMGGESQSLTDILSDFNNNVMLQGPSGHAPTLAGVRDHAFVSAELEMKNGDEERESKISYSNTKVAPY